jgi:hypothetical protein
MVQVVRQGRRLIAILQPSSSLLAGVRWDGEVKLTAAEVLQLVGHRRAPTLVLTPMCPELIMVRGNYCQHRILRC